MARRTTSGKNRRSASAARDEQNALTPTAIAQTFGHSPMKMLNILKATPAALMSMSLLYSVGLSAPADSGLLQSKTRPYDRTLKSMRLQVKGNRVLDSKGKPVLLTGVNIASLEWTDEGHQVDKSVERAIWDWRANLIRLPLAQDRWFGKMTNQTDGGIAYRSIVDKLVDECGAGRAYILVELHWSTCGKWVNEGGKLGQHNMPDKYSAEFWKDVARRYKDHPNVLFGLYNEPHDVSWEIWRDGGTITDRPASQNRNWKPVTYEAVGMQELYDTVRKTGAKNIVSIGGLDWGYDLSGVLQGFEVKGKDIIYETHPYPQKREWDKCFGDVSSFYAVYVGEWGAGGNSNGLNYGRRIMDYVKQHDIQLWTAWDFHPQAGPTLIRNWSYQPTAFGQYVKDMLAEAAEQRREKQ
jgi:endoglucanase